MGSVTETRVEIEPSTPAVKKKISISLWEDKSAARGSDVHMTSSDWGAISSASVVRRAMVRTVELSVPVWYSVR